jgi:predicted RNA binding protein YcfA (HicA-like mRNA interferase family)
MSRLPRVTGKNLIRALRRSGFVVDRVSGSHYLLLDPERPQRAAIVPFTTKTLKPGTLRNILRQTGLNADDLRELL